MKYRPVFSLKKSILDLRIFIFAFCCIMSFFSAQGQALTYAKALNNAAPLGGLVHTRAVAVDGLGNVYCTGYFEFTADFDPGPGVANLTSSGAFNPDIFIAKYDASGNYIYAKSVSGPGTDRAYSIAVDASYNVYITGFFNGTANFNPNGPAVNLVSVGGSDIFLAKYDASGNIVYAKAIGGTSNDEGWGIALDAASNVYITGQYLFTADFDPNAGTVNLTSAGNSDVFLAKYDASGNYVYARSIGGTSSEIGHGIAIDASSNAYITGGFQGIVDFDPGAGTANLTSAGNNDIFIARYDASGNYVYARRIGSTSNDIGYGIALDASSNAYITGQYLGTVDFDPGAGTVNLTSAGNIDIFLAKYDASGNYVYARGMGGTSIEIGYGVAIDAANNAYITGYFTGTADFDPGTGTVNLTSAGGSNDIFIARYDANGNYVYASPIGSSGLDRGYAITLDGSSNIILGGQFSGTVDFNPGAGTANLTAGSAENGYVVKLTNTATYQWAGMQGFYSDTQFPDQGRSIAVDASGNTYVIGQFQGTVDFDPGAGVFYLTSDGGDDIFLAKYDASGNYIWARKLGGPGEDIGNGIVLDGGNVYITGNFNGTVDFDPGAGTVNLTSAGNSDIFLAKYDASGNYVWARRIGGTMVETSRGIAIDASSNVYITGDFGGTVDFDPGTGTVNITSAGGSDIFLAKYDASGIYSWAKGIGGTGSDIGYAIALDAGSNAYITGQYLFTVDFDPGAGTVNLTSAGNSDIFLAKYDASGNYVYARSIGGTSSDIGYGITLDASSNAFITGAFQGTVDFDPGAGTVNLTSAGNNDIFLAKYDASGNYVWAMKIGSSGNDIGNGIALDAASNVYITGQFLNNADFDPGAGTVNLTSAGGFDIFLAKYDASGNYLSARVMGNTGFDVGYAVAVNASNVYVTGTFMYTVDFYPEGASSSSILTANNARDIFFAVYSNPAVLPLSFETVSAKVVKNGAVVQIDWSATAQINNAYFVAERSSNGVYFEQVSRVVGCLWCSELKQYTAMDDHPFTGNSFYRIKQVDVDGKTSYSKTVSVKISRSTLNALNIYPTVTNNAFAVSIENKGVEKSGIIQIMSIDGKLLQEQAISLRKGENKYSFTLAGKASGIYYVRLVCTTEQTSISSRIIKK